MLNLVDSAKMQPIWAKITHLADNILEIERKYVWKLSESEPISIKVGKDISELYLILSTKYFCKHKIGCFGDLAVVWK